MKKWTLKRMGAGFLAGFLGLSSTGCTPGQKTKEEIPDLQDNPVLEDKVLPHDHEISQGHIHEEDLKENEIRVGDGLIAEWGPSLVTPNKEESIESKETTVSKVAEVKTPKETKTEVITKGEDTSIEPSKITPAATKEQKKTEEASDWMPLNDDYEFRILPDGSYQTRPHTTTITNTTYIENEDGTHKVVTEETCSTCGQITFKTATEKHSYKVDSFNSQWEFVVCEGCNHKDKVKHELDENGKCKHEGCEYTKTSSINNPSILPGGGNSSGGSHGGGTTKPEKPVDPENPEKPDHTHVYGEKQLVNVTDNKNGSHTIEYIQYCTANDGAFITSSELKNCDGLVTSIEYIDKNENTHTPVKVSSGTCSICNHDFSNRQELSPESHTPKLDDQGNTICSVCGYTIQAAQSHTCDWQPQRSVTSNNDGTHNIKTWEECSIGHEIRNENTQSNIPCNGSGTPQYTNNGSDHTITTNFTCDVCGKSTTKTETEGHSYDESLSKLYSSNGSSGHTVTENKKCACGATQSFETTEGHDLNYGSVYEVMGTKLQEVSCKHCSYTDVIVLENTAAPIIANPNTLPNNIENNIVEGTEVNPQPEAPTTPEDGVQEGLENEGNTPIEGEGQNPKPGESGTIEGGEGIENEGNTPAQGGEQNPKPGESGTLEGGEGLENEGNTPVEGEGQNPKPGESSTPEGGEDLDTGDNTLVEGDAETTPTDSTETNPQPEGTTTPETVDNQTGIENGEGTSAEGDDEITSTDITETIPTDDTEKTEEVAVSIETSEGAKTLTLKPIDNNHYHN